MQILSIGLSHRTAPVEVREQLAFAENAIPQALDMLCPSNGCGPGYAVEGVLLSTCNRLEVYAVQECVDGGADDLCCFLSRATGAPVEVFADHLQVRTGREVVDHLCRVACGLDSLVLGESQIQGQVAQAHQVALAHSAAGPILNTLFRTALRAGKRARTETEINRHATSISHVAVELALHIFDTLAQKTAVLIGAGEMAELAAKNLVDHGVGHLLVVNRSPGRAAGLARRTNGEALGWDRIPQALVRSDIVISSTAAPHAILRSEMVAAAMRMRRNRPLFLIDIAVPRDIEPEVGEMSNVFLYDIDDLQQVVEANLEQRRRQMPRVEEIVKEEAGAFEEWLRSRDIVPTIVGLRQHMDGIRESELAWALQKLEHLSDQERSVILTFSRRLVNKILHEPTVRLKEHANGRQATHYTDAVRDLFGIEDMGLQEEGLGD